MSSRLEPWGLEMQHLAAVAANGDSVTCALERLHTLWRSEKCRRPLALAFLSRHAVGAARQVMNQHQVVLRRKHILTHRQRAAVGTFELISLAHVLGLVRAKDFDPAGLETAIPVVHIESNSYLGAAWGEGQTCHVALDQLRRTQIGSCLCIKELKPTTEAAGNDVSIRRPTDALDLPVYGKSRKARAC